MAVFERRTRRRIGVGATLIMVFAMATTPANAMKADLDECLAAGMNDSIVKPIDRVALLHTVHAVTTGPPDPAAMRAALEHLQIALDDFGPSAATDAMAELSAVGVPDGAEADFTRLQDQVDR